MEQIRDLEERVWGLIKIATENKDSKRIGQLNSIAQDIERIKREAERIEHSIDSIEKPDLTEPEKSVSWEITEGAITHSYLSITRVKRFGLIPTDGSEFEVETSVGQIFKTVALFPENRLRARREIHEFYEKAMIKSGDKVVWREIGPYKYHLSKLQ